MFERFLELKVPLMLFFEHTNYYYSLDETEWKMLAELIPLLKPIYDATVFMSAQSYVTMSCVIPIANDLLEFYSETNDDDSEMIHNLRANLYESLKKRIGSVEDEKIPQIACVLDPCYKTKLFTSSAKIFDAKENVIAAALKLSQTESTENPETNEATVQIDPKVTKSKENSLMSRIDQKLAKKRVQLSQRNSEREIIEQQLEKYLSEPLEDRYSTDPIKYWFDVGQKSFPKLFKIALDYLAIPATSGNLELNHIKMNCFRQ